MCGIVGVIGRDDVRLVERMSQLMYYRGPDDFGVYSDIERKVILGMRRLSVIDIGGGKQPMSNEDRTVWIVFNGEIYNSSKLRQDLVAGGHRFRSSHSDTEVLIHLYEEKGRGMLDHINGMFAFVIYDQGKDLIFGARDRVGIKPLYYVCKNGLFSFSSELKSLRLLRDVSGNIDFQSLYNYMTLQFIPSPGSIFEDIKKLPPAHYFTFDITSKMLKVNKYWDIPESSDKKMSFDAAAEHVRGEFRRAVLEGVVSDVPVACSLSGGMDSSSLVGMLCHSGYNQLKTFSLGFDSNKELSFDERSLSRKVAQRWDVEHHEVILQQEDLLGDLETMIWHLDEPYGGGLPCWYIFKSIKGKAKVSLTGIGGDELFGNYGRWRPYEYFFPQMKNIAKLMFLDKSVFDTLSMLKKCPQGYFYYRYFTDTMKRKFLFGEKILRGVQPTEFVIQKLWDEVRHRNPRDIVAYIDLKMQLPEEFLHVTDRFSMAHSVEARVPFLDHKFVELVMRIPAHLRTHPGNLKRLFIHAVRDVLVDDVIHAPKKGFVLPVDRWLRGKLKNKLKYYLGEKYIKDQGIFTKEFYKHFVVPYLNGKQYLSCFIWTVFMFQLWFDRYINGKSYN